MSGLWTAFLFPRCICDRVRRVRVDACPVSRRTPLWSLPSGCNDPTCTAVISIRHMPTTRLNPADFPGSIYAHELRRGAANLQFVAPLEAELRASHLQRARPRVRIWFSVTLALATLFTIDTVRRGGIWNVFSLAHLGALMPCTAALLWLSWSRRYERVHLRPASSVGSKYTSPIAE